MTPQYSIALFDIDSTLVSIEGIDLLAPGNPQIAALTEAAMSGAIPIEEVYARRLEIVRPTRQRVEQLAQQYLQSIVPDAPEVIGRLKQAGVDVHLITAGIAQAVGPLAERLGVPSKAVHAVSLIFKGTRYAGFDQRSLLTRSRGKETVVLDIRARSHGKAIYVGDGVTDLEAKDAVDLFVGFGGVRVRERVKQEADVFIEKLSDLLPLVFGEADVERLRRRS